MKITAIKPQVKHSNRYSVFVDDQYSFSLSESALLSSGVHSGQEVNATQLMTLRKLSTDDKLYNRALRYVAMRTRTTQEMRRYLQRLEASEELITELIIKLTGLELLNDQKYAVSFVRDRQLLRPTSRRKLQLELKQKGITESTICQALEENEQADSHEIEAVIVKKRRQIKYQDDQKLMQYLARQGFGYGDIKRALRVDEGY